MPRWTSGLVLAAFLFAARLVAASDYVSVKDPPFNAVGDGVADDTGAVQAAINFVAVNGRGTVFFPPGTYLCGSRLTIAAGTQGVTLLGAGGASSGAILPSNIRFSGAGSAPFLTAGDTDGTNLRNLALTYTNPAFTGLLVSFDSGGNDSIYCVIEDCFLGGAGIRTASALVGLDLASQISILRSNLAGAVVGIRGRTTHWSNIIRIEDCNFENFTGTAIKNAGQDWLISGNNFIALTSGSPGAYTQDAAMCGNAVTFVGNWFGDAGTTASGAWITFCGNNLTLEGNYIGGATNTTGVQLAGVSNSGICIHGNDFETHGVGIALGTGQSGISIQANTFTTVATPITGSGNSEVVIAGNTPPAASTIDIAGGIKAGGALQASSVTAGTIQATDVTATSIVRGTAILTFVPGIGAMAGVGAGLDLMNQIRPNAGHNGWLTFTEDAVADRWIVGTRPSDPNLYFGMGSPPSHSVRLVLGAAGIGVGGIVPSVSVDTTGALATRPSGVTLAAGMNSNIPAADVGFLRIVGPAGSFALGGFAGGVDGQTLHVFNTSASTMAIVREDPASAPSNRINTLTGGNVSLRAGGQSAATFLYDATSARWILMSTN